MSQENQVPEMTNEQLLQVAETVLTSQYAAPAFFHKLAANGITPRNEQEAAQLLQLGAVLEQRMVEGQTKQAADAGSFVDAVLCKYAGDSGQPSPAVVDAQVQQYHQDVEQWAREHIASSPVVKAASLAVLSNVVQE